MRILIATHAPLDPGSGAGQMALNLAGALRDLGHEALLWSGANVRAPWWRWRAEARRALVRHLRSLGEVDLLDCPESFLSASAAYAVPIAVARSVQPALRYLWQERLRVPGWTLPAYGRTLIEWVDTILCARDAVLGWRRASLILCLGVLERSWMERRFPFWKGKLDHYVNALGANERRWLAAVRARRVVSASDARELRFLWIGRWVRHKGPDRLLDFVKRRAVSHPADLFTIAGTGEVALPVGLLALHSAGRVHLVPRFDRESLGPLLLGHDVGLFTSRVEGWGLVLNEMLEAGLPVLATEAGGVSDLQPLFPTLLQPFPPGDDWKPPSERPPLPEAYSRQCRWDVIAERYLDRVKPLTPVAPRR